MANGVRDLTNTALYCNCSARPVPMTLTRHITAPLLSSAIEIKRFRCSCCGKRKEARLQPTLFSGLRVAIRHM